MPPGKTTLFEVTDPRGWLVVCTQQCWYEHILDERPFMKGWEDQLAKTITQPNHDFIYQDVDFPERHVYYRKQPRKGYYLKVVVEFLPGAVGEVVTAYPASAKKRGEVRIWPKSSV
jgi:hypothetical protein